MYVQLINVQQLRDALHIDFVPMYSPVVFGYI